MSVNGRTVVEVREMTEDEYQRVGSGPDRFGGPDVFVLDDGTVLFPVSDTEGNHAGAFHGKGVEDMSALEGAVIKRVTPMSDAYMEHLGWHDAAGIKPTCIIFEDGRGVYPAKDPEGNNYGCLRGYDDSHGPLESFEFVFKRS